MTRYTFRKHNLKAQFLTVRQYAKKTGKNYSEILQNLEKEYGALGSEVEPDTSFFGHGDICVITSKNRIIEYRLENPDNSGDSWEKECRKSLSVKTKKQIEEERKIIEAKQKDSEVEEFQFIEYSEDLDINSIEDIRDIYIMEEDMYPVFFAKYSKKIQDKSISDKELLYWLLMRYKVEGISIGKDFDSIALDIFHSSNTEEEIIKKCDVYLKDLKNMFKYYC